MVILTIERNLFGMRVTGRMAMGDIFTILVVMNAYRNQLFEGRMISGAYF
jgi:hypothetical protein